jgi:hypothetical protein
MLMSDQQEKRPQGRPRKGKDLRVRITRSISPELLQALEDVTNDQSNFIEEWLWQHPQLIKWKQQQEEK